MNEELRMKNEELKEVASLPLIFNSSWHPILFTVHCSLFTVPSAEARCREVSRASTAAPLPKRTQRQRSHGGFAGVVCLPEAR